MYSKNPNWPTENQLAIYKNDQGVKLGTTENKYSKRIKVRLNLVL